MHYLSAKNNLQASNSLVDDKDLKIVRHKRKNWIPGTATLELVDMGINLLKIHNLLLTTIEQKKKN